MKRIALFLLLSFGFCSAEEVTLTKSAILRAERSMISVKAGTVVELVSRDEKTLTVRYKGTTGTIPASSITDAPEAKKSDAPSTPPPAPAPAPVPAAPERGAQTNYGKAVEKAKENAAKHDKNLVKPTDDALGGG
jgi:hypothetical protein